MKRLLAHLLWLANSDPGTLGRAGFYDMKARILRRFATREGTDLQHFAMKPCRACSGTGWYSHSSRCRRCDGTGQYRWEMWVQLERWRLGGRLFHLPGPRLYERPDGLVAIEGRVEHRRVDHRAASEAHLWLALVFDRPRFWQGLTAHHLCGWTWWPMLALQKLACAVRWTVHDLGRCCGACGRRMPFRQGGWLICARCEASSRTRVIDADWRTAPAEEVPW